MRKKKKLLKMTKMMTEKSFSTEVMMASCIMNMKFNFYLGVAWKIWECGMGNSK